ncbi:MAG: YgjV family protein [Lachnospiraceae bacterium]|nr:YgjV family protein [Lachnospiraceae bacterium]
MNDILIGNLISIVSACFTAASSWTVSKQKSYMYQVFQCLTLAVASVFFHSWSGVTTLLLCAARNYLVSKNLFKGKIVWITLVILVGLGILVNNRGIVGWIVIMTTFVYTIGSYKAMRPMAVKANITFNCAMWALYDFLILDFVSGVVDVMATILTLVSILRLLRNPELIREEEKRIGLAE